MVFNALSVAGYVYATVVDYDRPRLALGLLASTLGVVAATRPFFDPGSRAAKVRSGVIRAFLCGFLVLLLSPDHRAAAAAFTAAILLCAGLYELVVISDSREYPEGLGWLGAALL